MMLGYKRTEVGLIPEDWDVKSVCELARIQTGPFGTLLKANEYSTTDGVPLISVGEIGAGSFRVTDRTPLVPAAVVRRLPQYLLRAGDIVFGRKGAVERSALVTEREDGWFLGSDGIRVRPQAGHYPPYMACQFQRHEVQAWLLQNATGTTMASLNQSVLGRVQVPYAPHDEQCAIATALSDVDALLGALERLSEKKRDLKHAVMQQLLTGKTRLPEFGKSKGMRQTELGELPEDWHTSKVEDILAEISMGPFGSDIKVSNFVSDGVPVLSGENIKTHVLKDEFHNFVTHRKAKSLKKAVAKRGDVVVTHRGTIGQIAYIPDDSDYENYVISQSQFRVRFIDNVNPIWVVHYFLSERGAATLLEGKGHTGVPAIAQATTTFRKLKVPLPSKAEQAAIVAIIGDMHLEHTELEAQCDKVRAVKQGMMQELLTGKTRLVPKVASDA